MPSAPSGLVVTSRPVTQTVGDPLRLVICPRCGYSLQGLPDEGVCPECGRRYDPRTVVLFGWARGAKATAVTAQPWVAAGLLAMNSVWLIHILAIPGAAAQLRLGMILAWTGLIGFIL